MDFCVTKGVTRNDLTTKWINLKTLGRGSYGVVHLVKLNPVSDDRVFGVKSCFYQDSDSLQKEQQILKQFVGCCNPVRCYGDALSVDHQGMLVYNLFLEYAPGGTLSYLMIPECDAKYYARMLLEGIRQIHKRGYVHCDLKPENILVFPSDRYGSINILKIADFRLLRRDGERHMPDVEPWMLDFPGTSVYMPPESVTADKISAVLDKWSLGCIVLEMITGKQAWECKNLMDLVVKIGYTRYPPKIPKIMSSTPNDFLMKCFQRDPNDRWTAYMLLSLW